MSSSKTENVVLVDIAVARDAMASLTAQHYPDVSLTIAKGIFELCLLSFFAVFRKLSSL